MPSFRSLAALAAVLAAFPAGAQPALDRCPPAVATDDVGQALQMLGACTGVAITIVGAPAAKRVEASVDRTTPDRALMSVARGQSWVIVYQSTPDGSPSLRPTRFVLLGTGPRPDPHSVTAPLASLEGDRVAQAVALRDLVKLSYRADGAAARQLRSRALDDSDPVIRRAAFSALGGRKASPFLALVALKGLGDRDPSVRLTAAEALAAAKAPDAARLIRSAALREPDPSTRARMEQAAAGLR